MVTRYRQTNLQTAMILAAGLGTRMRNLTRRIPKCLLPLNDLCVIDIILRKLHHAGFRRVAINLHHLGDQIRAHVGSGKNYGLVVEYSEEPILLGTGGGIARAEKFFGQETIFVANSDVLSDLSIPDFITAHRRTGAIASMAVLPSENNVEYSLVLSDERNNLVGFLPRGQLIPAGYQTGIFTGFQILSPEARSYLKVEVQPVISAFYIPAIQQGKNIKVYPFSGNWIDIGTKEKYLLFVKQLRSGEVRLDCFM